MAEQDYVVYIYRKCSKFIDEVESLIGLLIDVSDV